LAFLVVVLFPVTIMVYNFVSVFFSAETLSDILIENLIHSGMIHREVAFNLLSPDLLGAESSQDFSFEEALGHLSEAERGEIVEILAPQAWLELQVREIAGALNHWLVSTEPRPDIALDHRPIKESLLGGGAERLVEIVVDSWPSCSPQQVGQMQNRDIRTGEIPILYCEPPEPIRTQMSNFIVVQVKQLARDLPERVPLNPEGTDQGDPEQAARLKEQLRSLRAFGLSAWMLPFSLMGLMVSLAVRSWRDLTRWWGRVLVVSGIFTLIAGLLIASAVERGIPTVFSQVRAQAGLVFDVLVVTVRALSGVVLEGTAGHAVLLIIAGALLLFAYWLVQRRKKPSPASQSGATSKSAAAHSGDAAAGAAGSPPPVPPFGRK
jgi:hypothetical protein